LFGIEVVVRELLSVGSSEAFVCRVVVVVVVVLGAVVVVVQPTSAITQTPNTNGISFFIGSRSIRIFRLPPPFSTLPRRDSVEPLPSDF
jgi:hypothetical protein